MSSLFATPSSCPFPSFPHVQSPLWLPHLCHRPGGHPHHLLVARSRRAAAHALAGIWRIRAQRRRRGRALQVRAAILPSCYAAILLLCSFLFSLSPILFLLAFFFFPLSSLSVTQDVRALPRRVVYLHLGAGGHRSVHRHLARIHLHRGHCSAHPLLCMIYIIIVWSTTTLPHVTLLSLSYSTSQCLYQFHPSSPLY